MEDSGCIDHEYCKHILNFQLAANHFSEILFNRTYRTRNMGTEYLGRVMMLITSLRVFHLPPQPRTSSFHALHMSRWHPTIRIGPAAQGMIISLFYLPSPPPHPTKLLHCLCRHSPGRDAHLWVVGLSGFPPSGSRGAIRILVNMTWRARWYLFNDREYIWTILGCKWVRQLGRDFRITLGRCVFEIVWRAWLILIREWRISRNYLWC